MPTRREFIGAIAGAAGFFDPARAQAQAAVQGNVDGWPSRSVRVISPTGTGGPGQNFRLYADQLKEKFGQSFVLENMPGGSGAIGCMTVARAAPDGHTLLLASNSHIVLAPLVLTNSPVNVKKDFVPIALMFTFPFLLLVNAGLPVRTLKELVAYAKARPGELNFGSPGVGTGGHLVTELLVKRTGIKAVHVPYQATTQQMLAAAAGTLQFTLDTVGNSRGMVDTGKVVPLAVTGAHRAISAPDVPTFKELGYDGFDDLFEDIIRACDVAGNLGFSDRIEHGPGRHGHQHSYYLYVRDPDGHRTELLLPGIQVIDIDDEPVRCVVQPNANSNLWGLPAPRSWVEEATNFAGVEIRRPPVEGEPMTAEKYLAARKPDAVAS